MSLIENLLRSNIRELQPYSSARQESNHALGLLLDANENPYGKWNRYPDPTQQQLRATLAKLHGIASNQVFVGNGSDEVLDLLMRLVGKPGADSILTFPPTYGMYEVLANLNDLDCLQLPLTADFQIDLDPALALIAARKPKLLFVCSPNNPTGNLIQREAIEALLRQTESLVVVDEAYADFNTEPSWADRLPEFKNLVVLRTLSKAWGLAGARIGMALADPEIVRWLDRCKPPYNVSAPNQEVALSALNDPAAMQQQVAEILQERKGLKRALLERPDVVRIYPSDSNFLLMEWTDANAVYQKLLNRQIVLRNRSRQVPNCLRITVGSSSQNQQLLNALNT